MRSTLLIPCIALFLAAQADAKNTFVYLHDRDDWSVVVGYRVANGKLVPTPDSPRYVGDGDNLIGGQGYTLAWSKRMKMLFASGPNGFDALEVEKDGSLVDHGSLGLSIATLTSLAVHDRADATWLYARDLNNQIRVFEIESSFTATEATPVPIGSSSTGLDAAKNKLVTWDFSGIVTSFVIAPDGSLTPSLAGYTASGSSYIADLSPNGKTLSHVTFDGALSVLAVDPASADLTPIEQSQLPSPQGIGTCAANKQLVCFFSPTLGGDDYLRGKLAGGDVELADDLGNTGVPEVRVCNSDARGKLVAIGSESGTSVTLFRWKKSGALVKIDDAPAPWGHMNDIEIVTR